MQEPCVKENQASPSLPAPHPCVWVMNEALRSERIALNQDHSEGIMMIEEKYWRY